VHHGTVTRVLAQAGLPKIDGRQRPSKVDPYLPLILETLKKYPLCRGRHSGYYAAQRTMPSGSRTTCRCLDTASLAKQSPPLHSA
jgi:hypothetical protein